MFIYLYISFHNLSVLIFTCSSVGLFGTLELELHSRFQTAVTSSRMLSSSTCQIYLIFLSLATFLGPNSGPQELLSYCSSWWCDFRLILEHKLINCLAFEPHWTSVFVSINREIIIPINTVNLIMPYICVHVCIFVFRCVCMLCVYIYIVF